MSGIGIDIKVNGGQLRDAKRDAVDLRKTLDDVAKPVNIKIVEPPKTINEADFPQHTSPAAEVSRQNQALNKTIQDYIQESRRPNWRDKYQIQKQPVNPPRDIRQPDDDGGGRGGGGFFRNALRWGGRAAGYGAAIGGGFSLLSFLHNSVNQAADLGSATADLAMRGGTGDFYARAAKYGFTPLEAIQMQDTIGGKTGYTGKRLNEAGEIAAYNARKMGVGGETVAGYIAGSYGSTGANATEYGKQLKNLRDTAVALGARGRIEEVLKNNQEIMTSMVRGRGGAELTAGERTGTLAMQMALWGTGGQIGKGQSGANLMQTMDQGIRNGGNTPGQKIFLSQALGVEGVNSIKDVWEFNKRMNEGATPRNVKAVLDYSESIAKQRGMSPGDSEIFAMMNVRDTLGLNERQTETLFAPGTREEKSDKRTGKKTISYQPSFRESLDTTVEKGGEAALKRLNATPEGRENLRKADLEPMSLKGNKHRKTVAEFANTEAEVGEKLLPWMDNLKDSINRSKKSFDKGNYVEALTEMFKDNPIGQLMLLGAGLNLASKLPVPPILPIPSVKGAPPIPGGKGAPGVPKIPPPVLLGSTAAAAAAFAYTMWPMKDQVGEDAITKVINKGASPAEIKEEAVRQKEENAGNGSLVDAIWELVRELRAWLHKVNNDPLPGPPRYR